MEDRFELKIFLWLNSSVHLIYRFVHHLLIELVHHIFSVVNRIVINHLNCYLMVQFKKQMTSMLIIDIETQFVN